jgi:hypothetical protein
VDLPKSAGDVRFLRWQPSRDLKLFTAYARVTLPADDALDLMAELGMSRKGEEGALGLLPAPWGVMPGVEVPWWDAGPQTPPESFARSYGVNGEMRAKLEGGTLYLIVSDTGWSGD